jgi:hypothetical protein
MEINQVIIRGVELEEIKVVHRTDIDFVCLWRSSHAKSVK